MSIATANTLKKAYKPYDIVTDVSNNVGFISEVSVNESQDGFDDQIRYSVEWIIGEGSKHAWYQHDELKSHCNMLIKIAEQSCHPFGTNKSKVKSLFENF